MPHTALAEIQSAEDPFKIEPPGQSEIYFLDGLRGLAALFVVLHHASYLLHRGIFVQMQCFGKVTPHDSHQLFFRIISQVLLPFKYGNLAVVFFFVLSGFVIHLRYAGDLHRNATAAKFGWRQFMRRRVKRLYPPFLLALVLTTILFHLGDHFRPTIYRGLTPYSWINDAVRPDRDRITLLGNLIFLMPIYVNVWSGNGPLWSLGYEWWFYVLYPAFWCLSKKSIGLATGIMLALFALTFFPTIWPMELFRYVLALMMTWWLGVLLAEVYVGRIRISWVKLIPLMAMLALFKLPGLPDQVRSVVVGLGFCGLLSLFFWLRDHGQSLSWLDRLSPLGDMSYTLYVTHMPILTFLAAMFIFKSPHSVLPDSPNILICSVIAAIIFAWYAHLLVELPFTRKLKRAS